jgi:hypothetical protein
MGKKKKAPSGPQGAAAYKANLEARGLTTIVDDTRKKVAKRTKRTSGRVNSALSDARRQ